MQRTLEEQAIHDKIKELTKLLKDKESETLSRASRLLNMNVTLQSLHGKIGGKNNIFTKDMLFLSPSTAAAMVLGRNSNGLTEWKDKNGKTLKEIMNENI